MWPTPGKSQACSNILRGRQEREEQVEERCRVLISGVCCWNLTFLWSKQEEITHRQQLYEFSRILFWRRVCGRLVQSTCWHLTWFLWTVTPSVTVCKSPGACESRCGPSSVSSDRSLCQMSQNNCYDSQGHWENSSAAGLSAQMSPAVTPGGPPDPPWNNSLLQ